MTAQAPDQFFYKNKRFDLVGIKGSGLFTPKDFDIETRSASTGCWRGYIMRYVINGTQFILDGFWVNIKSDDTPPKINGLSPRRDHELKSLFNYEYINLNLKMPFTGSIWAGSNFIDSRYVHMGFQDKTAYRTVLKFDFEKGDIIKVEDESIQIEEDRVQDHLTAHPKSDSPKDIEDWISRRFSLDPEVRDD